MSHVHWVENFETKIKLLSQRLAKHVNLPLGIPITCSRGWLQAWLFCYSTSLTMHLKSSGGWPRDRSPCHSCAGPRGTLGSQLWPDPPQLSKVFEKWLGLFFLPFQLVLSLPSSATCKHLICHYPFQITNNSFKKQTYILISFSLNFLKYLPVSDKPT